MPNWSEGVLKIRGTKEQIENFIRNGIAYEDYKFNLGTDKQGNRGLIETSVPRDCPIEIGEDEITVKNTIDLYIKDTRRMFINSKDIYTYYITLCMGIDTAVRFGCTCIFKRQRNHRSYSARGSKKAVQEEQHHARASVQHGKGRPKDRREVGGQNVQY